MIGRFGCVILSGRIRVGNRLKPLGRLDLGQLGDPRDLTVKVLLGTLQLTERLADPAGQLGYLLGSEEHKRQDGDEDPLGGGRHAEG